MYNDNSDMIQYVVKQNDTLYFIAKAHNTTVDELKRINHLYSNTIYPNQILFIPKNYVTGCKTYLTASGESINDILNKHNLTLQDLEKMNDIDKLKLEPNQLLCVDKRESNHKKHIVSATDSIEYILAKYNISPLELLKLNQNKLLSIGEEIIVG